MTVRYPLESPHVRERARIDIGAYTPFPRTFHAHPLLRRNGRPYYIAGHVLSEILNWYQPVWEEYIDENGQTRIRAWQRFKGKALRLSYTYFANLFGLSEETIRRAVYFLRDRNLIVLETVYLQDETGRMAGRAVLVYPNWELVREIFNPMAYAVQDADVGFIDFPKADMSVEAADRYDHTGRLEASTDTEVPAERYGDTVREDEDVEETADRYSHTGRSGDTEGPKYTGRSSFLAAPKGIPNGTPKGTPNGTAVPPNKNNRDKNRQQKIDDKNKAAAPLSGGGISHDKISPHDKSVKPPSTRPERTNYTPETSPDETPPGGRPIAASPMNGPPEAAGSIVAAPDGAVSRAKPPETQPPPAAEGPAEAPARGAARRPPAVSRQVPAKATPLPGASPPIRSSSRADGPPLEPPAPGVAPDARPPGTPVVDRDALRGSGADAPARTGQDVPASAPDPPERPRKPDPERVLRDLGVPRKLRPRLLRALRAGDVTVEDFVAELARCYRDAAKGRVERPVVAAVASLLSDNRAPREFYDPDAWAEHLPEPVWELLFRAGWIPETNVASDDHVTDEAHETVEVDWDTALPVLDASATEREDAPAELSPEMAQAVQAVEKAKRLLEAEMSPSSFRAFVAPLSVAAFKDGTLTLAVPSPYHRDWAESRLTNGLRRKLLGILGRPVEVRFIVSPGGEE